MTSSNPPPLYQPSNVLHKNINSIKPSPTRRNSSFIASQWGIGWRTPLMMLISYLLSLLLAFAHLGLFLYLSNRPADGPTRAAPQSYVTTASNIISNAFALSLKTSLAVTFTQYLWFTLRGEPIRVGTIDHLFGMRSNLFMLFHWGVVARGPVLVGIAGLIWSLQVVVSFPPGALTISSAIRTKNITSDVLTFNASFFGNGSAFEAEKFSFYGFDQRCLGVSCPNFLGLSASPLYTLASKVLISGMADNMPSPCGANCSFALFLDVPYLECNSSTSRIILADNDLPPIYDGAWTNFVFNITTYAVDLSGVGLDTESQTTFPANATTLLCTPARANYALEINYENNIQTIAVTTGIITPLNIEAPAPNSSPNAVNSSAFGGIAKNNGGPFYTLGALDWAPPLISWYRDLQIMALVDSMSTSLAGGVITDIFGLPGSEIPLNNTIISNTRFHKDFGKFAPDDPPTLANLSVAGQGAPNVTNPFSVTQKLLNQALLNITLSVITDYGTWKATGVPIHQWSTINVYNFSKPMNLVIPYFATLFIALPILALGFWALYYNGVSAVDGGFVQMVTTTTGSATLERLAAVGCLGGDEGVPKELKELKVRFGELMASEGGDVIRRAGFGTAEETVPLRKGAVYGRSNRSWV